MRLKLTLLRADATSADIVVTTSSTATVGEIAAAVAHGDPTRLVIPAVADRPPVTMRVHRAGLVEPEFLMPNRPIGEAHVGSGLVVSLVELDPRRDWTRQRLAQMEATLTVISGPGTGRTYRIDSETNWLGRDDDCEIALDDAMVSKKHARVELEPGLVRFIDNNSANGLVVDGGVVNRVDLIAGARITVGETELEITSLVQSVAAVQPTNRAGAVLDFNRSPRVQVRFPGDELASPQIPTDELAQGFPLLILIAPLLMGAVLYVFTQSILSVIFVALSPLLMVGNYFSTRSERKRKLKDQVARFRVELAKLDTRLDALQVDERAVRLSESPSLREIVEAGEGYGELLWTRRPEHWSFLTVRLGLGAALSRTQVAQRQPGERSIEEFVDLVDELANRYECIESVPLIESLETAGGIGIAGPPAASVPYFRGLAAQILGLHSPSEVVCAALVDPRLSGEFDWIKWLPHASSAHNPIDVSVLADNASSGSQLVAALEQLVEVRLAGAAAAASASRPGIEFEKSIDGVAKTAGTEAERDDPPALPAIVLLVAGEPPVDRGRLVQLLERGVDVGLHPIWLGATVADIPAVCRTFVDVDGDTAGVAAVGYVREGRAVSPARIEGIDVDRAMVFARALSPVIDSSSYSPDDSDLPPSVSFLEIVGPELASDAAAVIDRWRQNESITDRVSATPTRRAKPGKLRALVGQAGADALHLDLRTQGPHALVGGTTGAGKSEFLQAWVLGMAAEYSPDRVTFLFVDYKGGSAFADCVRLPHCVGLVTDLNTHLVRRALTSLKAEIHFREHLLNRKKAKDLLELERRGDAECPPALVIVIDEFAALAGEIPEFVDGVVDIAQRGRSLGIHLIMATQRPAGVIRDNLRANTNLRVALRMADESDSTDVIGVPVAATFDPTLPGRGIAKTGPGRLTPFQSGYAGGYTSDTRAPARVDVVDLAFGQGRVWEVPADPDAETPGPIGPNDTARLVENFIAATAVAGIPDPRKPWLDELAPMYDLALLRQRTDTELLIGVADDPGSQSQRPVYFLPDDDGNLAVFGTGGSGKTTVLRTLAISAAITPRGGPVEVYGLDFAGGGLRMLEDLPHVGSIISGDDSERITRLFGWLRSLVDDRVELYGKARASSITEYRAHAGLPHEPRILLLVDGMATFRQEYEFTGAAGVFAAFQQLLSDGRQVGVHTAIAADRPGSVSPSVSASIQRRVALRLADENDYALLEAPADILSGTSPAGRAVVDGLETQVAVLGGTRSLATQAKAAEDLAATMRANGVREAPAIRQLPDFIPLSTLAGSVGHLVPIGISDDNLEPIGIEPVGVFMVSGPPASGRTTLLLSLIASLADSRSSGVIYSYFGSARSPVAQLKLWKNCATSPESAAQIARELLAQVEVTATERKKHVIVIESTADFLSTGADTELAPLIKAARRHDHFVIAESESSTWGQSWPLLMEIKSGRRGFALQPDQLEGELLYKTAFPRSKRSEFPAGRGWLVDAGKVRKVQIAHPD